VGEQHNGDDNPGGAHHGPHFENEHTPVFGPVAPGGTGNISYSQIVDLAGVVTESGSAGVLLVHSLIVPGDGGPPVTLSVNSAPVGADFRMNVGDVLQWVVSPGFVGGDVPLVRIHVLDE
jgi:hypothetical protein